MATETKKIMATETTGETSRASITCMGGLPLDFLKFILWVWLRPYCYLRVCQDCKHPSTCADRLQTPIQDLDLRQPCRPLHKLHCSRLIFDVTSTWLPIPFMTRQLLWSRIQHPKFRLELLFWPRNSPCGIWRTSLTLTPQHSGVSCTFSYTQDSWTRPEGPETMETPWIRIPCTLVASSDVYCVVQATKLKLGHWPGSGPVTNHFWMHSLTKAAIANPNCWSPIQESSGKSAMFLFLCGKMKNTTNASMEIHSWIICWECEQQNKRKLAISSLNTCVHGTFFFPWKMNSHWQWADLTCHLKMSSSPFRTKCLCFVYNCTEACTAWFMVLILI